MLRGNQIKLYSDGANHVGTALMYQLYPDDFGLPFDSGLSYIDSTRLTSLITTLELTGYDFMIHAIGDRAVGQSISAVENALNTSGDIGARHRITHAFFMSPNDYDRLVASNITVDYQVSWNNFDPSDDPTAFNDIETLFNNGTRLFLSSDWEVHSISPFVGIQNLIQVRHRY